jgi:coenzyme F420-reducing hydrogenase gamma subunit
VNVPRSCIPIFWCARSEAALSARTKSMAGRSGKACSQTARGRGPCHARFRPRKPDHKGNSRAAGESAQHGLNDGYVCIRCQTCVGIGPDFAATGVGKCAGLSSGSADRICQFTRDPRRASSPLCPDLGFRYAQVIKPRRSGHRPCSHGR